MLQFTIALPLLFGYRLVSEHALSSGASSEDGWHPRHIGGLPLEVCNGTLSVASMSVFPAARVLALLAVMSNMAVAQNLEGMEPMFGSGGRDRGSNNRGLLGSNTGRPGQPKPISYGV
jgi:hypothetical protein